MRRMDTRRLLAASAIGIAVLAPVSTNANEALAVKYGCVACHAADYTRIGPSFIDIAERYAMGGKPMVDHLANQIAKGSKGLWGDMPMAAQFLPTEADRKALSAWILEHDLSE